MKNILMTVAVVVLFCAGCATIPPLPTKTGKPDVTIQASKEAIFNSVTNELITMGYMLREVNENKDIIAYVIQHPEMMIVWTDMPVDEKVTINLVQTTEGVRMLGSISYIGYPGTDNQRVVKGPGFSEAELRATDNQKLHNVFLRVKRNLENN